MPHSIRAVVARSKGEPVTVETIEVPDPGPGEVIVDEGDAHERILAFLDDLKVL